jgi:enterochelin esterase-like enzyme
LKQTLLSIFILLWMMISGDTQTFQDFLNRVNAAPDSLKAAIVDSFVYAVPSFPYIEDDTLVHFLFMGNATSITVPGDANIWNAQSFPMTKVQGTDLWYYTKVFEPDARLDYKFVLNGNSWILDPLNPNEVLGGFGPNSELRMPACQPAPEIEFYPNIPHGSFKDTTFHSINLGNSRTVRIYLPPEYDMTTDNFPMILFHDGLDYVNLANAKNVLDYLTYHEKIRPLIGVFVPPVNRTEEYAGSLKQDFSSFIIDELLPWIDQRFRTKSGPRNRATLGASNGGNIALWLGLNHPDVFGKIAAQSSNVEDSISSGFQYGPKLDLELYLDLGTYDIPVVIPLVHNLRDILGARRYSFRYEEYHEGHSWGNWRAHIDNALQMFFPGNALWINEKEPMPRTFVLHQNYPNPFNASTVISYEMKELQRVRIDIYDVQGRLVAALLDKMESPGRYDISWNGKSASGKAMPSGIYYCRLQNDQHQSSAIKLLLLR